VSLVSNIVKKTIKGVGLLTKKLLSIGYVNTNDIQAVYPVENSSPGRQISITNRRE